MPIPAASAPNIENVISDVRLLSAQDAPTPAPPRVRMTPLGASAAEVIELLPDRAAGRTETILPAVFTAAVAKASAQALEPGDLITATQRSPAPNNRRSSSNSTKAGSLTTRTIRRDM